MSLLTFSAALRSASQHRRRMLLTLGTISERSKPDGLGIICDIVCLSLHLLIHHSHELPIGILLN
jgi:hypothetical protein